MRTSAGGHDGRGWWRAGAGRGSSRPTPAGRGSGRPTRALGPAGLLTLIGLAALPAAPPEAGAQTFDPGRHVPGIRVATGFDAYDISGTTAPQLLRQLETAGRPSWIRIEPLYRWSYEAARIPRMDGTPSDQCVFTDFSVFIDVTVRYPRWNAPEGASPELEDAWSAFQGSIDSLWVRERDEYLDRAEELLRRARGHEDYCPLLRQRFHSTVLEVIDRARPLNGRTPSDPVQLRWPPEGYDDLLRAATSSAETARPASPPAGSDPAPGQGAGAAADEPRAGGDAAPGNRASAAARPRVGIPRPETTVVPSLEFAIETDLKSMSDRGLVAGLYHQGTLQFFDAFGTHPDDGSPVTIETPIPVAAFTEVLVATMARGLDAAGMISVEAPISTYVADLPPRLGRVTLAQLLDHRAGLDNAAPRDSTMAWADVVAELSDRALFTEPGVIPSYSAYSYGLATRVLEEATGTTLEDALRRTLLTPLGMTSTTFGPRDADDAVGGLPVTLVTPTDLLRYWYAWLGGQLAGTEIDVLAGDGPTLSRNGRAYSGGLWIDRPAGVPRAALSCSRRGTGVLVEAYPRTNTLVLVAGLGGWPRHTGVFMLDAVGEALRIGNEVFSPANVFGSGGVGISLHRRPCGQLSPSESYSIVDFGPRAEAADWTGRYINGEWFFALEEVDGLLVSPRPDATPWLVHHFEGDLYFASLPPEEGSGGFAFRLFRGPDGRRYLMLGDRAFLNEGDRVGG